MIDLDWGNDERSEDPQDYLVNPNSDNRSRLKAFLGGWIKGANSDSHNTLDGIRWVGLGMAYGSILGDVDLNQRRQIYCLLLSQYLATGKVNNWTEEQRKEALRLMSEA